jgi:hypothetical protein
MRVLRAVLLGTGAVAALVGISVLTCLIAYASRTGAIAIGAAYLIALSAIMSTMFYQIQSTSQKFRK